MWGRTNFIWVRQNFSKNIYPREKSSVILGQFLVGEKFCDTTFLQMFNNMAATFGYHSFQKLYIDTDRVLSKTHDA